MQRRLFLKRLTAVAGTAAVPITAAATAVRNNAQVQESGEALRHSSEALRRRLDAAEQRLDRLQKHQKRALRSGVLVAGMLVGVDLSLML